MHVRSRNKDRESEMGKKEASRNRCQSQRNRKRKRLLLPSRLILINDPTRCSWPVTINVSRFSCKIRDLYLLPVLGKDFADSPSLCSLLPNLDSPLSLSLSFSLSSSHAFCLSYSVSYSLPAFFLIRAAPRRAKTIDVEYFTHVTGSRYATFVGEIRREV